MEATLILTVGLLAVLLLVAAAAHCGSRHAGNTRILPAIQVTDPDVARRLIIDHAASFSDHPAVPFPVDLDAGHPKTTSINSAPYGPLWRVLRRNLTAGILHPSRLAHLAPPAQRDAVAALVADIRRTSGEVVVVRDALYAAVFELTARLCFGDGAVVACERDAVRAMRRTLREFFHSGVDAGLLARSRMARLLRWRQWRDLVGTRRRLAEVFVPVIEARRQSRRGNGGGGGDFSSYLDSLLDLRVPDEDPAGDGKLFGADDAWWRRALRDDEVVRLVWEFLSAGTETVVACVEWTLARLVSQPEVQKKLRLELTAGDHRIGQVSNELLRDVPYLRAVILESLRLHPPVPFVLRDVAGAEVAAAVGGITPLPDGSPVRFIFMAEEIGKDGKAWTDPQEFRPERFVAGGEGEDVGPVPGTKEIRMMPFGAGRRHCPGAGTALVHVGCFVAALVREFEWAPPPDDGAGGVDLTATNALFVKVMASPLRARVRPLASP